ncbi:mitogen-activated protein kinase kinase kinase 14 [Melanotaenia boesemani]|uniref:mitogen-activated protein kinase kinase kinase 14 n=1 Tax=Melanotaenia boesemani TaxID=1250792 RepID=UPI001C047190|nr:mitogen-activated protein kinase kinase kinase 14 [Melanotaenia boesemani]XP_041866793.1 mitogen-activated protein kinase kinase kinase 14 [Melanotaenia boesemani]XP_041866802.1 mitogen-activated protein kinase kinase kinase 14 [Melanotaenia boesemani]XP_041866812.1 mitogen-activated protein kinase kinase kinase 14 [Melanotaenia boesemani]
MAVRQRLFNSTAPFSSSPKAELKASYPSCSATEQKTEEGKEEQKEKMGYMPVEEWAKNIVNSKLLTHGTAEQMGAHEMPSKTSIIAQAECETQDSQEFSPSCSAPCYVRSPKPFNFSPPSERNNVASSTTASVQWPCGLSAPLTPRKKSRRRQRQKRKVKKKQENRSQRRRTPSGVPEQESGGSLVPIPEESSLRGSNLSTSCCSSIESSVDQEQGTSLYGIYGTGSSCSPLNWPDPALHPLSSYDQDSSSDSLSSLGNCSLALAGLRGCVSQGDRCFAWPFFKDVERDARVDEDEFPAADSVSNEGLIFYNEKINPVDSEYKEGSEYVLSQFIKEGSYGEVYSAHDVKTGFTFAVKKIAMKRFNSEEVGAWSALRSPCVVELFGVVREGPYVIFLMDHKSGSLGDLIVERGRLPEDLSLHYHSQVLTALEYLVKKKVVHLDIKADNVLLSEDGRNTFLCDFGRAERLDNQGQSLSGSKDLKGTETHMAPEIVKGDPRGAKADVWSICCMLLHMLNGCQPWTRYYTCRLYLKIANEPPPLREIPPDCSPFTAEVLKAGLQKDPVQRSSASDLKEKTVEALRKVGGLTSPVKGPYTEPLYVANKPPDSLHLIHSSIDFDNEEEHLKSIDKVITAELKANNLNDGQGVEAGSKESKHGSPTGPQMLISEPIHKRSNKVTTVPELELRKLENDFYLTSLSQLHSAEMQEQLLSCLSSDHCSNWEPWDKKDSGRWSLSPGDDLSSGVYSYNSQPDVSVFSMDLLGHTQVPPPCCFEGVDVCIRDFSSRSIRIRETRRVKVGHIATGISDQISERVFTLKTPQGLQVAHDDEVQESGLELCCVPAPDFSSTWMWRIRDGVLETR